MTSKIKVDNINKVSDDSNIIKKCGTTTTIGSGASNPIVVDGSAVTIGRCGGTVALASGASQTGFGRTGTVDWQTGSIKTSTFTAVSGEGYFCNTAGGSFTVNLPAGSAGAIVSVQDYNNTFDSNSLIVDPNGSEKINGGQAGGFVQLQTEGEGITLVYIDATVGWRSIQDNVFADTGTTDLFVTATGGNATVTCGNFKTHIFTGPGTLTVTCAGNACGSNTVDYLVVAGGGGSGRTGGGGGGGGFRSRSSLPSVSPLNAPAGLPVSVQGYPITVGSGGVGGTSDGVPSAPQIGSNSIFSTITSTGGGGGQNYSTPGGAGPGGSGGAGGPSNPGSAPGGTGNTPPVSPPQGNNGGPSSAANTGGNRGGGGGGGAGAAGGSGSSGCGAVGAIGSFVAPGFIGPTAPSYGDTGPSGRYFSAGGGGAQPSGTVAGGTGGGGIGGGPTVPNSDKSGPPNKGGGAGSSNDNNGNNGGPGIVMVRYKFQ